MTYTYPAANPVDVRTTSLVSPATRAGNYDLIGRLTVNPGTGDASSWIHRNTAPGEFGMATQDSGPGRFSYTLNAPAGVLPGGQTSTTVLSPQISWDINSTVAYRYTNIYGDSPQYLGQRLAGFNNAVDPQMPLFSYDFTQGASGSSRQLNASTSVTTTLDYDIGYSYVAMGEWDWRVVDLNGNTVPGVASGNLLFVNGDRTPASGIPVAGTATYDARSLSLLSAAGTPGIPFTLTADFGQRTIATLIGQDFHNIGSGENGPAIGIHVSGSAPFSNDGSFDIPLTGTVNFSYQNEPVMPPSQSVTGDMNGAFFGPRAEQVGGVFSVHRAGESSLLQDAFVGRQRGP